MSVVHERKSAIDGKEIGEPPNLICPLCGGYLFDEMTKEERYGEKTDWCDHCRKTFDLRKEKKLWLIIKNILTLSD